MAKTCYQLEPSQFLEKGILSDRECSRITLSTVYNGKSPPKAVLETNSPRGKPSFLSIWGNKTFIMNKTQFLFYREDKTLFIC